MAVVQFSGQLNANEIFGSIYNMIISQQVLVDTVTHNFDLASRFKTDGTLYGDTKTFYTSDVLKSRKWTNYAEAANLLATNKPADPKCQIITLDQFRQIDITVDNYLSKRAWGTEGVFSQFHSYILSLISTTKKIYENTMVNAYVGTVDGGTAKTTVEVALSGITQTGEEKNRLQASMIAESLANLFIDLKDYSRDYNEYQFLQAYDPNDFVVVWNSAYVNKIKKIDLPTMFHKDGLIDKFEDEILPARYFGAVNTVATKGTATGTVRALDEIEINGNHYFAGDSISVDDTAPAGQSYTVDANVICKVIHKDAIKYMGAFEVATSFFNPRSLTENHYLTWGYSMPAKLYAYPVITLQEN